MALQASSVRSANGAMRPIVKNGMVRQQMRATASMRVAPMRAGAISRRDSTDQRNVKTAGFASSLVNYQPQPNGPESWPVPEFVEKTLAAFPDKVR